MTDPERPNQESHKHTRWETFGAIGAFAFMGAMVGGADGLVGGAIAGGIAVYLRHRHEEE